MKIYFRITEYGVVIITHTGERIGSVSYGVSSRYSKGYALGYSIDNAYRGQGIMPRAVKAYIEYSDEVVFQAVTLPDNEASKRVLLKCGFIHVNVRETQSNPLASWAFEYIKPNVLQTVQTVDAISGVNSRMVGT